jgi:NAD(P)-dependent dehydrogenase (short-subunit alcohol dehydrogenase family)
MAAVVIITGGGGFLGQCLASSLLETGRVKGETGFFPIEKLVLADIAFPPTLQPTIEASPLVVKLQGDVSDPSYCDTLFDQIRMPAPLNKEGILIQHVSIFHLGAVMSGDGERDFDLCMRVNLHGFLNMIEGARQHIFSALGFAPKFIFASAGATIGSGAPTDYITGADTISDATRATPHTTYGATKACCELLLTDYARRGFVDARGLRLPTIVVRAGAPNAATTSCFSGVIREPLAGVDVVLPIAKDVPHAVTGMRAAIAAMRTLHDATHEQIETVLGFDRTVFLPAVALSLGDLEEALIKVTTPESHAKLGKISYKVDAHLSAVVGSFPTKIDAYRALKLGVPAAPDAETLVREYMADFGTAVAAGIEIVPAKSSDFMFPVTDNSVAVVTGGGSGIGRAVAERLSQGGWTVVLAGRSMSTLKETKELLGDGECLCVQTDVTVEKEVEDLFRLVDSKYGRVDLLFNNAGVNSAPAMVETVLFSDFERVLKTNVSGPFLCARTAMSMMARRGGGRIINNGSISAHVPRPGSACYTTSKHALLGLTKCIALDGRALNVACGQIDFGNVVSEMSRATNKVDTGALQANGTYMVEPSMSLKDAAETFWAMANLPLEVNILQMTVMASAMPFVGRG